jgi:hypothetical protein
LRKFGVVGLPEMVSISPNPALKYSSIFNSEAIVKDFDFRFVTQEKDTSKSETKRRLTMSAFPQETETVPGGVSFLPYHHILVKLICQLRRLAGTVAIS